MAADMQDIARAGQMMPRRLMRESNSSKVHEIVHRSVVQDTHSFTSLRWQAKVPISDRVRMTMNLISNMTLATTEVNTILAAEHSSRLERHLFHVSPTKEAYNQSIASRIMEFYKKPQLVKDGIDSDSLLGFSDYDEDDVVPRDSPLMTPLRPRLEPFPSPPPDISPSAVRPTSGDSILVDYLDNGRNPEIARVAARQVLPLDEDSAGGKSSLDGPPEEVTMTSPTPQNVTVDTLRVLAPYPGHKYKLHLPSTRPTRNSNLNGNYTKSSLRTSQVGNRKTIKQRPHAMLSTTSKFTENIPELVETSKKNISQHRMYTISDDYTDSERVRKNRLCSLSSQNAGRRRV